MKMSDVIGELYSNYLVFFNQVFPDNFMKREVLALKVNCLAKNEGCNWKGDVRDLEVNNNEKTGSYCILIQCVHLYECFKCTY